MPAGVDTGSPDPWIWFLGVHGGAGVSTLTHLIPGTGDLRRCWPGGRSQSPLVVAVCRTHRRGLEAAQALAGQYIAADVPPHVVLVGLVTVADAPRRPPAPLRRFKQLVEAGYPATWHLPWVDEWRDIEPDSTSPMPPAVVALTRELTRFSRNSREPTPCTF